MQHAVNAVQASAQTDQDLNGRSVTIAVVGREEEFTYLKPDEVEAALGSDQMELDA